MCVQHVCLYAHIVYVCAHTCTIYCNDANLVTYAVVGEEEEDEEEEKRECCLLVLNLVSSTLPCIRRPRPQALFKTKGGVGRGSYKMMVAFRPQ